MGCLFGILAVVQMVMHYVALLMMIGGVGTFLLGNAARGKSLFLWGLGVMIAKYLLGGLVIDGASLFGLRPSGPGGETSDDEP